MFAAVRLYAAVDAALLDDLAGRETAIRRAITSVPGALGCEVIRTRDGLIVILFGEEEASVAEAGRRFASWMVGHVPALRAVAPSVWAGPVLAHAELAAARPDAPAAAG